MTGRCSCATYFQGHKALLLQIANLGSCKTADTSYYCFFDISVTLRNMAVASCIISPQEGLRHAFQKDKHARMCAWPRAWPAY